MRTALALVHHLARPALMANLTGRRAPLRRRFE
jgi:hypothetical protein